MKVVSAKECTRIDEIAILPDNEISIIESVGKALFNRIKSLFSSKKVLIFVGPGNNGADALSTAINLLKDGYDLRVVQVLKPKSVSCKHFFNLFKDMHDIIDLSSLKNLDLKQDELILDGIFGIGFEGKIEGTLLNLFSKINASDNEIISIDVPSGLDSNGTVNPIAIKATYTFFIELAKTSFFINQGWDHVGKLEQIKFGLGEKYISQAKTDFELIEESQVKQLLPKNKRSQNKYSRGFVIGIAGSKGMEGAANLSARAALRSGSGIVKLFMQNLDLVDSSQMSDEIVKMDLDFDQREKILETCSKADSIFMGPGMGRSEESFAILSYLIEKISLPTVLDADALYFFNDLRGNLPSDLILTPHRKEMLRLLKKEHLADIELIQSSQAFAKEHKLILVLKGAPTFIFHPENSPTKLPAIIARGDPAMATAGTGDVLTGVIAALLAQKLPSYDAALLGVYLHAIAGEEAAKEKGAFSVISSDLIERLPKAFLKLSL